jgi:CRISPR/Cas system CMR-associated protein Cmr1 (group 7 of RAMP superfamily)
MSFVVLYEKSENTQESSEAINQKRTDNIMAKRKRTDNTMAKRKRTDNTMAKRKRIKRQNSSQKTKY